MSAFNPYFPQNYNPYQQAAMQYQQAMTQNIPNMQAMPQNQNNGGFIRVQNEMQAREYPVAPGGSVTFIDENAPYCYTKSMGLSQLEPPVFKRFRLVEEDMQNTVQNTPQLPSKNQGIDLSAYALKSDVEVIKAMYDDLKIKLESSIKEFSPKAKKEAISDE